MYRDSFGNTLLPFFADAYANAYFSRGVPYQLSDVDTQNADTVVVERAERFLPEMAKNPPVLEGSLTLLDKEEDEVAAEGAENLTMRRPGTLFPDHRKDRSSVSGLGFQNLSAYQRTDGL